MISIIVPVYNAEKFIRETIQSVLNQTYKDFELILVDDCSKDGSVDAIKSFDDSRVILVKQEHNAGAYAARNRGLKEAGGRYIAFLDSDDCWEPCKLEHELAFMERENAGFVFTGYEFADASGKPNGKKVFVPEKINYQQHN